MIYFLVTFVTALGLGIGSPGIRLLSGTLIIPIALFFGNLWLHLPLTFCSRGLALFALVRMAVRKNWKIQLSHPVALIPLIYLSAYFFLVRKPFALHEWDEFSNWGAMPKQIFLFNQVSDPSFSFTRFLEYTPGWPLLLDYAKFVEGGNFKTDFLIFAVVILGTGLAAAVWDTVFQVSGRRLYAWTALLLMTRLYLGICLNPIHILSELPLEALFCAVTLLGLRWAEGIRHERDDPMLWGIVLCAGYLVKKSYLGVALIFLGMSISYLKKSKSKLGLARLLGLTWFPFVLAVLTWHFTTRDYPHLFKFVPRTTGVISTPIIYGMLAFSRKYLWSYWLFSLVGIFSFALGLRDKKFRSFFCILLAYNAVYFVGLYWLYLTTFPEAEGIHLASFDRYSRSLFKTDLFASILFLFIYFKAVSFSRFFENHRPLRVLLPIVVIVALAVTNLEQLQFSFHLMNKYGDPSPIVAQAPGLIKLLDERGWRGKDVWMIDEGQSDIVIWQSIYSAIDRAAPLAFHTPFPPDPEKKMLSEADLKKLVSTQQIIWPVAVGLKTESSIRKLIPEAQNCPGSLDAYYWVRSGAALASWACVKKEAFKPVSS